MATESPKYPELHLRPWHIDEEAFPRDGQPGEIWEFLLQYAILAPSSHNSQPWLFRIHGETLELYADRSRSLRVTDPDDRQLTIACGCALFHLRVAMEHFGCFGSIATLPDQADPDLIARLRLGEHGSPNVEDNLLLAAIPKRRTNRQPFDERPLPEPLLSALQMAAQKERAWLHMIRSDETRFALAELIAEGDRIQWAQKRFRLELAAWLHSSHANAHDGIPMYSQDINDILSYAGPLAVRTFDMGAGQAAKNQEIAMHSPALMVLGTHGNALPDWISAGQALARVLLRARIEDVYASYLNQPIEVEALRPRLAELLDVEGTPQLILRMGFGEDTKPTPRRFVEDVLI